MAGDVTVAVVSAKLAGPDTGTADFTKSGFGTPKACIVILTRDGVDDTIVSPESRLSIGFSDFTNNFCIVHQDEDSAAKVDCDAIKSNTACYLAINAVPSEIVRGTASTITDGVRLTNTLGAGTPFATVIMFGGADTAIDARSTGIASAQDGTATVTHAGLTDGNDKLIFFICSDISGEDSASSGINNSYGVCHITGNDAGGYTFTQRCLGWASDHNSTIGAPNAIISTDRVLDIITEAGDQDWGLEVTAFSSSGGTITVTTRDNGAGANMEVYSLIVDLDDRKAKVFSVDSPISGATWVVTGLGFKPQVVGLLLTDLFIEDVIKVITVEAGVMGISSNSGAGEETCHSWYNEAAVATTNTNNLFRSRAIDLRDENVSTVLQDHSHLSFDSDGFTNTINTENETVAKKWGLWTIEEAAAAAPIDIIVPAGAITLTGSVPTARSSISVPAGALTLTGFVPTAVLDFGVSVPRGDIALVGFAPAVDITDNIEVTVPTGTITLTGFSSPLDFGFLVPRGDIALTRFAPIAVVSISVDVPVGALALTGFSPSLDLGFPIPKGDIVLTGFAPTIDVTANVPITVNPANVITPLETGNPKSRTGDVPVMVMAPADTTIPVLTTGARPVMVIAPAGTAPARSIMAVGAVVVMVIAPVGTVIGTLAVAATVGTNPVRAMSPFGTGNPRSS